VPLHNLLLHLLNLPAHLLLILEHHLLKLLWILRAPTIWNACEGAGGLEVLPPAPAAPVNGKLAYTG
jgi:hypothetical protein